jgi:hypothetical protein
MAAPPGSWADWAKRLASNPAVGESGTVFKLAEQFAESAAISTEAATSLLLWLGSVCMIHHAQIQWPSGIWQPGGLTMSIVEEDGVPIDSIVNAFISLARNIGLDPINDTVKEGPAGLIARLESAGSMGQQPRGPDVRVDSLSELASLDTASLQVKHSTNRGNARALIYPSGRALLSYLYDTSFFNALDELIQHGNLNLRGKASTHKLTEVHMSTLTSFYQGALVTLTSDSRVQNNMTALLRQMLIFWPTAGTKRHRKAGRIDIALHRIQKVAQLGNDALADLSDGVLRIPEIPEAATKTLLEADGVGIRYTVLNREQRIAKLAIAVAFWRIAEGGKFEITNGDLAIADSALHLHEMGGRLFELAMAKGRMGHEFMRLFLRLLDGETLAVGEELAQASELSIGTSARGRLNDMSVITGEGKLDDEYRYVKGSTQVAHKKRWKLT